MAHNAPTKSWTDLETENYYLDKLPGWAREYLRELPIFCSAESVYGFIKENKYEMTPKEMMAALDADVMYFLNQDRDNFPVVTSSAQWAPLTPRKKLDIVKKYI